MDSNLIEAYVDGELAGSDFAEFERALGENQELRDRVAAAQQDRDSLRHLLKSPAAPDVLRARLQRSLDSEDLLARKRNRRNLLAWTGPVMASAVAAAALLLFVFENHLETRGPEGLVAQEAVAQQFREQPVMTIAANQTSNEVSQSIRSYFRSPVRPPRFSDTNVRLRGWRPVQLIGRAAVELDYGTVAGSHVVTVHMVNAADLDFRGTKKHDISGAELWVDHPLGFTTVSYRDSRGIGYIFSAEAGEDELLGLVAGSDLLLR